MTIFNVLLIMVIVTTLFGTVGTLFTAILDLVPSWRQRWYKRLTILFCLCCLLFILCSLLIANDPNGLNSTLESYNTDFTIWLIVMLETLALTWIYGMHNYWKDLKSLLGTLPDWMLHVLKTFWGLIVPLVALIKMIANMFQHEGYFYQTLALFLTFIELIWIPLFAVREIYHSRYFAKPNKFWGPYLLRHRQTIEDDNRYGPNWIADRRNSHAIVKDFDLAALRQLQPYSNSDDNDDDEDSV